MVHRAEARTPPSVRACRRRRGLLFLVLLSCGRDGIASSLHLYPPWVPAAEVFARIVSTPPEVLELAGVSAFSLFRAEAFTPTTRPVSTPAKDVERAPPPPVAEKFFTPATTWTTVGVFVGMSAWAALGVEKDDYTPFMTTREKFFGRYTYAGGADKCSHFILSAALARELAWTYEVEGHPRDQSLLGSLGVTVVSGAIEEVGDNFTPYGYPWEEIIAATLRGATGECLSD